jgi:FemAB-related protein (PEP-CTERM system-associated)
LQANVRNKIRQAIKKGLTVDSGKKYLDDFYRVLAVNHRDLGTPLHSKSFFRKVLDEFDGISGIFVVKYESNVIAGMLYIHLKGVFSEPWASSLRSYNHLRPNNLLYWEAINYACRNGFKYFDFGRSTINSGTYNFKRQWGSDQKRLDYHYFLNRANKVPAVNANENKYKLAINIWRKLPLKIANAVGPRVIRYLPEL